MSKYYTLKIKDVVRETADTITIHFRQPLFTTIKYEAGQFLTLIVPINGKTYRRAYSLSSAPHVDSTLAVSIKRVPNGIVSNYLNDHIKVGDRLDIMEPMGHFKLSIDPKAARHIVLFGAGSGVTPLMSIAKSVLAYEPKSSVSLIYGNRNESGIIFAKVLEEMQKKYAERFNLVHTLTQAEGKWNGYTGRIDKTLTINVMNLLPKADPNTSEYFMCGPEGMMEAVVEGLTFLKVPAERIHRESFNAPSAEENTADANGTAQTDREVTIVLDGETHKIMVASNKFVLDAALDAGLDMPYSCQSGLCTACRGRCVAGEVKMLEDEGLTENEIKQGYVLTCVSKPLTDNVKIEIG